VMTLLERSPVVAAAWAWRVGSAGHARLKDVHLVQVRQRGAHGLNGVPCFRPCFRPTTCPPLLAATTTPFAEMSLQETL